MISRKYKFHVLKRKIADFFEPSEILFFLARSNAKSHSFFIWVVMFDLTIFWVRKTIFSISEHRNLVNIIEDELFVELSTTSSLTDAFCSLSGTVLGRSAGQKNVRKQHFCLQNFVAFVTLI